MKFLIIDRDESSLFLHVTFIRKMLPNSIISKYKELPLDMNIVDNDIIIADYDILKSIRRSEINNNCLSICITPETISTVDNNSIFDRILQKPIHYDELKSCVVDLMFKIIGKKYHI